MDLRNMECKIIPADKKHRRLAILAAVVITVLGLLAVGILQGHLGKIEKLAERNPRAAEQEVFRLAVIVLWVGGLVGMGGWFWWLGRRINLGGRFPPAGMKVVKQTRVRTGAEARALANLAQAMALLCVIAGTVGMWYLHRLAVAARRQ